VKLVGQDQNGKGESTCKLEGFDIFEVCTEGVHVSLSYLTLHVPESDEGTGSSCAIVKDGQLTMDHMTIRGEQFHGVEVGNSGKLVMTACNLFNCAKNGLDVTLDGVATVRNCCIQGSGDHGIRVTDSAKVSVVGCLLFRNKRDGLDADGCSAATLSKCLIKHNKDSGVVGYGTPSLSFSDCCVSENGAYGFHLEPGCNSSFAGTIEVFSNPQGDLEIPSEVKSQFEKNLRLALGSVGKQLSNQLEKQ